MKKLLKGPNTSWNLFLAALLVIECVIFGAANPKFLSLARIFTSANSDLPIWYISLFVTFVMITGGIDIQVLGMGHNGHIAFNEPGDDFGLETHLVDLTESTIDANQRFFDSRDEVPRHALSMGIKNIMQARRILMVVSGEEKADILYQAFCGRVTKSIPASILQLHPDVTLVGDKAALHKLVEAGETVCG